MQEYGQQYTFQIRENRMVERGYEQAKTYQKFKSEYTSEAYINLITCRAHRSFLAKLRGGSAPLEIETGRYVSTPAEYRTCKLCDTGVEDEIHFVLYCPALSSERHLLVIHMRALIPTYETLNSLDQLCCIMSEANKSRKISKYLFSIFMKRQSLLTV